MTTKTTKRSVTSEKTAPAAQNGKKALVALRALKGIWKRHRINPLAYQRRIRREADRRRGI